MLSLFEIWGRGLFKELNSAVGRDLSGWFRSVSQLGMFELVNWILRILSQARISLKMFQLFHILESNHWHTDLLINRLNVLIQLVKKLSSQWVRGQSWGLFLTIGFDIQDPTERPSHNVYIRYYDISNGGTLPRQPISPVHSRRTSFVPSLQLFCSLSWKGSILRSSQLVTRLFWRGCFQELATLCLQNASDSV